ncbi:MAG: MSHA biogenesis protein MshO [Oleispira sp.]|jgi:MSHA biogenesis protein MshO
MKTQLPPKRPFKQPLSYKSSMAFTLVELVMVMVVLSILATGSVKFISQSAQGLVDSAERQALASTASIAVEKVLRQVRRALPNSVHTFSDGGFQCLELVPISHSSEYISVPTSSPTTSFNSIAFIAATGSESGYVAVYPSSKDSIYGTSPATIRSVSTTTATAGAVGGPGANMQTITFDAAANYRFPTDSPRKRFFLVDQPVSYCDDADGRLWRYQNYGFLPDSSGAIPTTGLNRILIADSLQANSLSFNITPAQMQRNAVVRMSLVTARPGSATEKVDISQEVQLRNVP